MEHPSRPVEYPDDRFTQEELERLKNEPMLIVEVIEEPKEEAKKSGKKGE